LIIKIDRFGKATFHNKPENAVLPDNSITSLVVDRKSEVWIGTENGIARYNSVGWATYPAKGDTLPGLEVSALTLDTAGRVWAGFQQSPYISYSQSGLAYFNSTNWQSFIRDYMSIKSIAFDKTGDLWTVCFGGVYKYHNKISTKVFNTIPSSNIHTALGTQVNALAFDKNYTPYIGTGMGVKKFVAGTWVDDSTVNRFYPAKNSTHIGGVNINVLLFDPYGTFWIGTSKGLLKCTDGNCVRFDTSDQVLPNPVVQCVAPYAPNRALIGTKRGLVHLTERSHATYTNSNSPLIDNDITAIVFGGNGDAWIGTRSGGLTVLKQPTRLSSSGPNDNVPGSLSMSNIFIKRLSSGNKYRFALSSGLPVKAKLSIISLSGRLIKRLLPEFSINGITFTWDRTNMYNRIVPRGMYLAVISYNRKTLGSSKLMNY
jgi:ligand-binding sensor domain-containing protein